MNTDDNDSDDDDDTTTTTNNNDNDNNNSNNNKKIIIQMFGFRLAEITSDNHNHRNYLPQYVNIFKKMYPSTQEPQTAPIPVSLSDSWEITNTADYDERRSVLWVKRQRMLSHRR